MSMTLATAKNLMRQIEAGETCRPESIKAAKAVIARWSAIRAKRNAAKAAVKQAPLELDPKQYANLVLHSDVEPYEVVGKISETTLEIRKMKATLDPTWKPEITPGGFAGHCHNQQSQRWLYEVDESAPIIRMRKVKPSHSNRMMNWKSPYGFHRVSDKPCKFHDYNY